MLLRGLNVNSTVNLQKLHRALFCRKLALRAQLLRCLHHQEMSRFAPILPHNKPATTLAANSAFPVARLNRPKADPRSSAGGIVKANAPHLPDRLASPAMGYRSIFWLVLFSDCSGKLLAQPHRREAKISVTSHMLVSLTIPGTVNVGNVGVFCRSATPEREAAVPANRAVTPAQRFRTSNRTLVQGSRVS